MWLRGENFKNCCLGKSITPSPAYLLLFLINKLMNSIFMSLLTPWTSLLWNPYLYCSSETQSLSRIMAIFFSTQNSSTKKKSDFILDRYTWTQPKKYWQHTLLSGFFHPNKWHHCLPQLCDLLCPRVIFDFLFSFTSCPICQQVLLIISL